MNALQEALKVQKSPLTHYDEASLRKIIDGLVQLVVTERKEHAKDIRELELSRSIATLARANTVAWTCDAGV